MTRYSIFILAIIFAAARSDACAAPYAFTRVVDSSGELAAFGEPAINNQGDVTFWAFRDDSDQGIYRMRAGILETIADETGPLQILGKFPSINEDGLVSFPARRDDNSHAIFTGSGGALTIIDEVPFFVQRAPLNDNGVVAYPTLLSSGDEAIVASDGTTTTTIVTFDDQIRANIDDDLAINSSAEVAFFASAPGSTIFRGDGGPLTTIADESQAVVGDLDRVGLNNAGTAVFGGLAGNLFGEIMTGDGGPIDIVVSAEGPLDSSLSTVPTINNLGTVAYSARLDTGEFGIFVGPNSRRVIVRGDPLDGSVVTNLGRDRLGVQISVESLNDRGEIAFRAILEDGREAVYIATPIPEPSGFALLIFGLCAIVSVTRVRR